MVMCQNWLGFKSSFTTVLTEFITDPTTTTETTATATTMLITLITIIIFGNGMEENNKKSVSNQRM